MKHSLLNRGILIFGCILLTQFYLYSCTEQNPKNPYVRYELFEESKDFSLKVNDEPVFVAKEYCFGDSVFNTSQFTVEGETTIEFEANEPITSFEIRPYILGIKGNVSGNRLTFQVSKPEMLYVEVNDLTPLCLFQTPPEEDVPSPDDPNVKYFAKGVHEIGILEPRSGETIYLEQGAHVKGRVYAENVNDVTIKGRGIIDARGLTDKPKKICGMEFKNSKDIKIEGIGLRTGAWWQSLFILSDNIDISYMNLMSFGVNNDGIDIDGVQNIRVSNCFIGCGDDGFGWHALDAEANGEPPSRNCVAENCVIYNAHAGNGLRVGASMETGLFEDITFRDITVLAHANAGIRSDHSDWAMVRNLSFENFYIEQPGRPIEVRVEKTRYSNSTGFRDERGHIEGLYFNNVVASGGDIILEGYGEDNLIENVVFKGCTNAGKQVSSLGDIKKNEFVKNISFQ